MKVKIKIPGTLKDIKLSQYQKFINSVKDSEDAEFINRQMVSCLCDIEPETVKQITRSSFNGLVNSLTKILNDKPSIQTIIKHEGKEYGLIPSMEEMTVGEQADLDSMYGDYSKRQKVMAILYRPITVKSKGNYLIEDYTGKEEPLDLTLDVVMGADVFFCNILKDCMNITLNYIKGEEIQAKLSQTLDLSGSGIKIFIASLEETFLNLKEQLNYR